MGFRALSFVGAPTVSPALSALQELRAEGLVQAADHFEGLGCASCDAISERSKTTTEGQSGIRAKCFGFCRCCLSFCVGGARAEGSGGSLLGSLKGCAVYDTIPE